MINMPSLNVTYYVWTITDNIPSLYLRLSNDLQYKPRALLRGHDYYLHIHFDKTCAIVNQYAY